MLNPINPLGHGLVKLNPLSKLIDWVNVFFSKMFYEREGTL
jgi:hypothetical protein